MVSTVFTEADVELWEEHVAVHAVTGREEAATELVDCWKKAKEEFMNYDTVRDYIAEFNAVRTMVNPSSKATSVTGTPRVKDPSGEVKARDGLVMMLRLADGILTLGRVGIL